MAEKMAESNASKGNKQISRSTKKDEPAGKDHSNKTTVTEIAEPREEAELERLKTEESTIENSGSVRRPGQLCDRVLDYIFDHFDDIIKGLMKGIDAGNASGARLLFDLSRGAHPESSEAGLGMKDSFGLLDFLDPAFDLESLSIPKKPAVGKPSQAEADTGLRGDETQLTIARGA